MTKLLSAKNISYAYNADGSRATMTTPAGTFSYGHDALGRWTGLQDHTGNITNWNYDVVNRMTRQTMANGTQTNFTYNALSQLVGLSNLNGSGSLLSKFGHESNASQMLLHDAVGNLKSEIVNNGLNSAFSGTTNYNYDNKDQLLNESSTRNSGFSNSFGYDAMGNPVRWKGQARTFNLNNQETTGGTSQFNYDGNGNPTTYKGSSFAFNENDKLTRITTSSVVSLQAGYRSDGLRAWKNTANGTTYFLYDGSRLLCEFDGSGNLKNTNVWGANGLLARRDEVASSTRFYVWDDRGNTAQSLNADGSVASNFNVSSWGDVRRDSGTADVYAGLGGQFGNYLDVETGLTLCGQRYYDSAAGRWINRDPISYAGGLNVYGYVGNNPTNFVDPSGLCPDTSKGGGGGNWPIPPLFAGIEQHHSFPKFLGGDPDQVRTPMDYNDHRGGPGSLHSLLRNYLKNYRNSNGDDMSPRPGNSGANIQNNFPFDDRVNATGDFYNGPGAQFSQAANDFFNQYPGAGNRMGGGIPNDVAAPGGGGGFGGGMGQGGGGGGLEPGFGTGSALDGEGRVDVGGGGCFSAGTLVVMADGRTKPIEEIKKGDRVLSRDEKDMRDKAQLVLSTSVHQVKGSLVLHFSNGEVVATTGEHKFYIIGKGFVMAGEIGIGVKAITLDGRKIKLVKIDVVPGKRQSVYNFTVDVFHTYFVGKTGIWVHNMPSLKDAF